MKIMYNPLSSQYNRVEYIASTGTQYIDLDYICKNSSITVELDMAWSGSNTGAFETFFGFMYSTSQVNPRLGLHKFSSRLMFGANATATSNIAPEKNERFIYKGDFISGAQKLYKNGSLIVSTSTSFSFSANACPTYIFARYCPNSMNYSTMQLYYCKIWEGNTLIRHLVPCYNALTNEIGLYDLQLNRFFTNSGTGTFLKGEDTGEVINTSSVDFVPAIPERTLLPKNYRRLSYIESGRNGATLAYLDTGLPVHMNWKYEIILSQSDSGTYRCWGAFNQSSYVGPNCSLTYISNPAIWALRWESTANNQRYVALNTRDSNKHIFLFDNGNAYVDGVNKGTIGGHSASFVTDVNAYLFTINPGNTVPSATLKGKIYSYKVWNNEGILQQWFIPCENKINGDIGMYDIIQQEYHGSISGFFQKGEVIK